MTGVVFLLAPGLFVPTDAPPWARGVWLSILPRTGVFARAGSRGLVPAGW